MSQAAIKTIESFLEDPEDVILGVLVNMWGLNDGGFIIRGAGIAKCVIAVSLAKDVEFFSGH